jgi:hypothetical protein
MIGCLAGSNSLDLSPGWKLADMSYFVFLFKWGLPVVNQQIQSGGN